MFPKQCVPKYSDEVMNIVQILYYLKNIHAVVRRSNRTNGLKEALQKLSHQIRNQSVLQFFLYCLMLENNSSTTPNELKSPPNRSCSLAEAFIHFTTREGIEALFFLIRRESKTSQQNVNTSFDRFC